MRHHIYKYRKYKIDARRINVYIEKTCWREATTMGFYVKRKNVDIHRSSFKRYE